MAQSKPRAAWSWHLKYAEHPCYFTWNKSTKHGNPEQNFEQDPPNLLVRITTMMDNNDCEEHYDFKIQSENVVGRIHAVRPEKGERSYQQTLLLHVPSSTYFKIFRTVTRNTFPSNPRKQFISLKRKFIIGLCNRFISQPQLSNTQLALDFVFRENQNAFTTLSYSSLSGLLLSLFRLNLLTLLLTNSEQTPAQLSLLPTKSIENFNFDKK